MFIFCIGPEDGVFCFCDVDKERCVPWRETSVDLVALEQYLVMAGKDDQNCNGPRPVSFFHSLTLRQSVAILCMFFLNLQLSIVIECCLFCWLFYYFILFLNHLNRRSGGFPTSWTGH